MEAGGRVGSEGNDDGAVGRGDGGEGGGGGLALGRTTVAGVLWKEEQTEQRAMSGCQRPRSCRGSQCRLYRNPVIVAPSPVRTSECE